VSVSANVHDCIVPVHEPLHLATVQPAAGCATRRTTWSLTNAAERQVPGHETPFGTLVTRPCPEIEMNTTRWITNEGRALEPVTATQATIAESAITGISLATVRTILVMIVSSGMRVLPASPRVRRRLFWLGGAVGVAAAIAAVVALIPSKGPPNPTPKANEGSAQVAAHVAVPITAADRRAIDRTLDRFIPAAVGRKNADLAWSLAGPELKAGSTLAEWRAGTTPVPSYPVKVQPFHDWSTLDNGKSYVDFTLLVHPRIGVNVGAWTFAGEMVEQNGRWLVNRLYTIAVFQPVRGSKHEIGPADFAAPGTAAASAPPAGKSVLGGIGLLPILLLLGLVPLTGVSLGVFALARRARRRLHHPAAPERSRELPPLPTGYRHDTDGREREPAGRS
jgi:hypothetical protein